MSPLKATPDDVAGIVLPARGNLGISIPSWTPREDVTLGLQREHFSLPCLGLPREGERTQVSDPTGSGLGGREVWPTPTLLGLSLPRHRPARKTGPPVFSSGEAGKQSSYPAHIKVGRK